MPLSVLLFWVQLVRAHLSGEGHDISWCLMTWSIFYHCDMSDICFTNWNEACSLGDREKPLNLIFSVQSDTGSYCGHFWKIWFTSIMTTLWQGCYPVLHEITQLSFRNNKASICFFHMHGIYIYYLPQLPTQSASKNVGTKKTTTSGSTIRCTASQKRRRNNCSIYLCYNQYDVWKVFRTLNSVFLQEDLVKR